MFSSWKPGSSKTWRTRRPGRRWSRDGLNRSSHNICVKYNYYVFMTSNICVQHSYYNIYVVRTKIVCAERLGFPNFRSISRDFRSNLSQNSFEIFDLSCKILFYSQKYILLEVKRKYFNWGRKCQKYIENRENFERKWPNFVCSFSRISLNENFDGNPIEDIMF